MDVLIVGAGAMGRWFAGAVERDVAFADVDPVAAEDAAAAVGGRARAVPLDTDESFGVVCVAVPIPDAVATIEAHAGQAQQAVVDVTGAMGPPLAAMARTAPARERMSLHPLFGPDNGPGNVAVVAGAPGPATDGIRRSLEAAGNTLVETTAEEHDEAMQTVQGRAHAAILAFAMAADEVPEGFETPVYEGLTALVEQVTAGNPRVYWDIQETFDGADDVAEAARTLAESDAEAFAAHYDELR